MRKYLGLLDGQELVEGYAHYIWMSERCLEGIAWCEKIGLDYEIVPKNWVTVNDIRACMDYLGKVKKAVLLYATTILNAYHHSNYDEEQWNILLSQWLNLFLASYFDKYLKLKQVERMGVKCECDLNEPDGIIPILDYLDYDTFLETTDDYHVYQYTKLYQEMPLHSMLAVRKCKKYTRLSLPPQRALCFKRKILRRFKEAIFFYKRIAKKKDEVVLLHSSFSPYFTAKLMLKTFGRVMDYSDLTDYAENGRQELSLEIDTKWRTAEHVPIPEGDEFTGLMCRMLQYDLPIAYVEKFSFLRERAMKAYKYAMRAKAILFTSSAGWMDELCKIYLMSMKKTDALICGIEHGGIEGIDNRIHMNSEYEICDSYYTWGYSKPGNPTFIGMPAVKMVNAFSLKFSNHQNFKRDILYISYCCSKNIFRIDEEELIFDKTIKEEKEFLRHLPIMIRKKMRIRFFPDSYGWKNYRELGPINNYEIDTEPTFYKSLESTRLVITEWWQTTMAEALLANKAVIIRRSPLCITTHEAMDDLKALKEEGILVESFQEMKERLEEILPNIDAWWNDPNRQRVINNFRSKYLCSLSGAEKRWYNELVRLANL